jgi:hypothetical protein
MKPSLRGKNEYRRDPVRKHFLSVDRITLRVL